MNYLKYIEHAAENLQFWLWYRDYAKRFSELPPNEKCLAPEWTVEQGAEAENAVNGNAAPRAAKKLSPETAAALAGTDFDLSKSRRGNPFNTPPRTPMGAEEKQQDPSQVAHEVDSSDDGANSIHVKAADAFEKADLKWQPCKGGSADNPGGGEEEMKDGS